MGTATSARRLGDPTPASTLVAIHFVPAPYPLQHDDRRCQDGVLFPAIQTSVFIERRHALVVPNYLDRATSRKPAVRPAILANADVHPLRSRDGTLPLRSPLPRLRDASILRPIPQPDRHARRFHPHQESHSLPRRAF